MGIAITISVSLERASLEWGVPMDGLGAFLE